MSSLFVCIFHTICSLQSQSWFYNGTNQYNTIKAFCLYQNNKTLDQLSGANSQNIFFAKFYTFSSFFQLFAQKNIEKGYFNQGLECAVPKHWSKYKSHVTTHMKLLPYHRATVAWFWSNSFL